ncbi:MAG: hypothetical protein FWD73_07080 [Polyangiaceae bacterium]|nr:hypothetical protein [Polyangiaceae bacterium]
MDGTCRHDYNLWIVVHPPEKDVPGQWLAHCLEFDTISQGNSFEHALKMIFEAIVMVVHADRLAGREPMERRAPEEFYEELYALLGRGEKVSMAELEKLSHEGRITTPCATQIELHARHVENRAQEAVPRLMRQFPVFTQPELACC